MTAFWVVAAALVAGVLAVLLRPLLRSPATLADDTAATNLRVLRAQLAELDAERAAGTLDAEQHAAARAELERRALEEASPAPAATVVRSGKASAIALTLALPLGAVALYLTLGSRAALDPEAVARQPDAPASEQEIEAAVAALGARLKAEPGNAEGWALLARTQAQLGRLDAARQAFAEAVKLRGDDPHLLADYADVMAMSQGRSLVGEPEALLARALAIDPGNLKALALAGTAAMQRRDFATAVQRWTQAREVAPPDSPLAQGLDNGIAQARAAMGSPGATTAAPAVAANPPANTPATAPATPSASPSAAPGAGTGAAVAGAALDVTVTLSPALASRLQPGDTLFVFARAADGPRMPLAVARQPASSRTTLRLDDSMAMTPQMKLSAFTSVVVAARISRSGSATPQSGDLAGESAPRPPSGAVSVLIDRVLP